jgi:ABC-type transport system involved in multi-copper enzyme maturation permease subunit
MIATTALPVDPTLVDTRRAPVLANLLRSEWVKLRSVRSTKWSMLVGITAIIVIGISGAIAAPHNSAGFDPVATSLSGVLLAQVAMGVLGVLAVTSEYSTGMIRSTFAAAPQRGTVIAAKAIVFGATACAAGASASLVSFLVGQAVLGQRGVSLGHPGALRSIIGVGLYLGLLGVFAVGLGTAIRRSAGAIAVLFGLIVLVPALVPLLPASVQGSVTKYLPYDAGHAIFTTTRTATTLPPWAGLAVFALYAAASLAVGVALVRRRDA